MPSYNPYLLQLPSVSKRAELLIGYAIAVLSTHLAYNGQSSREEIISVLSEHKFPAEINERLRDIADEIANEVKRLKDKEIPRLLNDLRRLGVIEVYDKSSGVEKRISPDESGWRKGYARPGPTMGPAASVLRRCLARSDVDARFCLQLAAAVAALSFLYGAGGSSKLRMLVKKLLTSSSGEPGNAVKEGTLDENKVRETLQFFRAALGVVRQARERFPGLVPSGYLRVIEALMQR